MHDITSANLHNAYGGESMAHMRYRTWGDKAEQDGFPTLGVYSGRLPLPNRFTPTITSES